MDYAMAGGQTLIYYINAYTTLISAVLGVCFSIGAVIAKRETSRTMPCICSQKPCFNVCRSHSYMQKCTHYFIRCYNGNVDSTDS